MKRKYLVGGLVLLLILIVFVLLVIMEWITDPRDYVGIPTTKNKLQDINIYFRVSNDPTAWFFDKLRHFSSHNFPRQKSYNFMLTIENTSNKDINNCVLIFDERFRADIKNIRINSRVYNKNNIPAKTKISIGIDSDIGNPNCFRDVNGDMISLQVLPKTFSIQSLEGYGEWSLVEKN